MLIDINIFNRFQNVSGKGFNPLQTPNLAISHHGFNKSRFKRCLIKRSIFHRIMTHQHATMSAIDSYIHSNIQRVGSSIFTLNESLTRVLIRQFFSQKQQATVSLENGFLLKLNWQESVKPISSLLFWCKTFFSV